MLASLTAGDDKHPPPPPPPSTHPTVEGGISPAIQRRLAGPRRVASDHGVSTLPPTEVDKADDEGLAADVEVGHGSSAASRPILARGGKRRHSFNLVRDAPEPWQILSRSVVAAPIHPRAVVRHVLTNYRQETSRARL